MIRFTDNSILIEINVGSSPVQQLPLYQKAIIDALKNLNSELDGKQAQFINYWLSDLLQETMFNDAQMFAIEKDLKDGKGNKELKNKMLANIVDV